MEGSGCGNWEVLPVRGSGHCVLFPLLTLIVPVLFSLLSRQVTQLPWPSRGSFPWTPHSVQVRELRWQATRTGLSCGCVSCPHPPFFTHHPPTSLCWLLHLSLTLGFRVLMAHSPFFLPSSLFLREHGVQAWLPAERWSCFLFPRWC